MHNIVRKSIVSFSFFTASDFDQSDEDLASLLADDEEDIFTKKPFGSSPSKKKSESLNISGYIFSYTLNFKREHFVLNCSFSNIIDLIRIIKHSIYLQNVTIRKDIYHLLCWICQSVCFKCFGSTIFLFIHNLAATVF